VLCYFVFVLCLVPGVVLFCFRSMSWPRCCVILFSFYILTPVLPVFLDLTLLITLSVFSKAIFWLVNHGKCLNIFFLTEKNETKTIVKIVPPRNVSVDPGNYPRWSSRLIMQLSVFQVYLKFLISNLTNINKLHLERYNIDPAWYWCIWRIAFQNYTP
jgi:hypothetical protein